MPKFSTLGITVAKGFNGSYIDTKILIERRVVLNINKYELRPSAIQNSRLCMMQLSISGLPVMTWHGSMKLIEILLAATDKEHSEGVVCFPIEECIIVEGDDGGYYLKDADDTCLRPTQEQIDQMTADSRRRGSWRKRK